MFDKIFVFGDSIAYGKWDCKGGWVARLREYIDLRDNPEGNVQIYNLGIPGEVAVRMVNRVKQELEFRVVDPQDETLVLFAVGVNDSCPNNWMTGKQTPENEFKKAYEEMIRLVQEKGWMVKVAGLAPVNPAKSKGLKFTNEEVRKYDQFISEVCLKLNVEKIELWEGLTKVNYMEELVDAVHPNDKGHKMIFDRVKEVVTTEF